MSKYKNVKCPYCIEIRKSTGLHKHIKTHGESVWEDYQKSKPTKKYIQYLDKFKCCECDYTSELRHSVSSHWWCNHTEAGEKHLVGKRGKYKEGRTVWNKGLTKHTDARVKKYGDSISEITREKIKNGTYVVTPMGEDARRRLSERQSVKNTGGKSKWYVVDGKKVQGTYEKKFAEELTRLGILWDRINTNTNIFKYIRDGKTKSYSPDFFIPTMELYVEIKGFWWGDDEEKMKCVKEQHSDKKVVVLFGKNKLDFICEDIKERLPLEPVWSW